MNFKFDFSGFEQELAKHFNKEHHIITEDLIRYWFIQTHLQNGMPSTEVPYIRKKENKSITPLIPSENKPKLIPIIHNGGKKSYRVRADLYYGDINNIGKQIEGKLDCVFEFKYHRRTRYSDCCTGTDCGSVFGDLNRLSILDNKEKYFVYVFDDNMYDEYYKDKKQNIFSIFRVETGEQTPPKEICINSDFDKIVFGTSFPKAAKNYGEIKKGAFKQFDDENGIKHKFDDFNYKVNVLYSNKVCEIEAKKYYLIICQVI